MRHWNIDNNEQREIFTNNSKAELSSFLASRVLLVVLSIVLIAVLSAFTKDFSQKNNIDSEVFGLQTELAELEAKRDAYLEMINYYDSEEYLKQQAKRNLDLKETGENVVVISDDELSKYLEIEATLTDLKKNENNDIEDSIGTNQNEVDQNGSKLDRQFRIWWEYIF